VNDEDGKQMSRKGAKARRKTSEAKPSRKTFAPLREDSLLKLFVGSSFGGVWK
jgi:hypothetical protein